VEGLKHVSHVISFASPFWPLGPPSWPLKHHIQIFPLHHVNPTYAPLCLSHNQ